MPPWHGSDTLAMARDFGAADSLLALAEKADDKWADPIVDRALISYRRSRVPGLDPLAAKPWITQGMAHAAGPWRWIPTMRMRWSSGATCSTGAGCWAWSRTTPGRRPCSQSAKADLEKATVKNPAQAGAWASLSHLYYQTTDNSLVDVNLAARKALEADAFLSNASVIMNRLFLSDYDLGQFPECRSMVR